MIEIPFFFAQAAANAADPVNAGFIRLLVILAYLGSLLVLGFFASRLFRGTKNDCHLASQSLTRFSRESGVRTAPQRVGFEGPNAANCHDADS